MTALPPQPSAHGARPLLLLPALQRRADGATVLLRRSRAEAVEAMPAVRPGVVVMVGDDVPTGVRSGPECAGWPADLDEADRARLHHEATPSGVGYPVAGRVAQ
ncbi:MAG: hypothetical protein JWP33_1439 [Blastococcus sp.]|jgi:hypothetical protein|nr:hypothetical protein [Blastococcus sp.]